MAKKRAAKAAPVPSDEVVVMVKSNGLTQRSVVKKKKKATKKKKVRAKRKVLVTRDSFHDPLSL